MAVATPITVNESQPSSRRAFGPGQPDMWYFVVFDSFVFSCYLITYVLFRSKSPEDFLASQVHLSQGFGIFNTVALLTSSWLIARCVHCTRSNRLIDARPCLVLAAVFGLSFMASKSLEWTLGIRQGLTLTYSEFFTYYYFITGYHMVHMIVGLVALGYIYVNLRTPGENVVYAVETGATYWHMVDLLWVFIFALLYLMR
jgi:nitric oxide reductase NorE protein